LGDGALRLLDGAHNKRMLLGYERSLAGSPWKAEIWLNFGAQAQPLPMGDASVAVVSSCEASPEEMAWLDRGEPLPMLAENAAFVQRPKQLRPFEAMLLVHRT
jgi:hypothetical protein